MKRILIIEDDPDIALSLKYNLEREGEFTVQVAHDGEEGLRVALDAAPDLIILDLNLPRIDGIDVCRRLRATEATAGVPIIMLTARVEEADRIRGLEMGADDYVTKPFSLREIVARVRAVLRRSQRVEEDSELIEHGPLRVDIAGRRVSVEDRPVSLTRKEFDLLAYLMRNPGRVVSRERLLDRVWGYDIPGETRTVDVHIRQLRKKLGPPADGFLETVVGVGYRFRGTS